MQATFKRPEILKWVCRVGFASIIVSFVGVFSPSVKKMGDWYPALFGLVVACKFMSYIGVWHMKRWGVQLFIITFFLNETLLVATGTTNYIRTAFAILYMIPMLIYYKRMDQNL
ncbi:MAG: hypothetical protein ACJ77K_14780 [Bacteroidia bacterium]